MYIHQDTIDVIVGAIVVAVFLSLTGGMFL